MQLSEREIMKTFAFKKEIDQGASAHSSLSESMTLDNDHMLISYHTEFEGKDLDSIKNNMRKVELEYSNEPAFMKDV
jgi:hypothetical protein